MNFPLISYRISGWLVTLTLIFLAIFAIKTKQMWRGKYVFIAILLCFAAFVNVVSSVTAILMLNNLFLTYILAPVNFTLKALYLREQHPNKAIRWGVILLIMLYVFINMVKAIYNDGYKEMNTLGVFINRSFFIVFTLWNLTLLFKNTKSINKLRQNPDFWFTATMLCFAFFGIASTIITDVSYSARSNLVLYIVFISENLIDVFIYYGYYRGMKLLR